MNTWRSETWAGAAIAVPRRTTGRRLLAHYVTDLLVSVGLVLAFGWFVQTSASDLYLREALITQNEVYVAISRFTPQNLLASYVSTIVHMTRSVIFGISPADGLTSAVTQAFAAIGWLLLDIARAAPNTLIELYQRTSGVAAQIVLAGFGMAIGTVFAWLLAAKVSLWRLMLASALSPIAVSMVFLVLQGFMVLMLDAFFWCTWLAPYAVACPVLCTLYWVAFPNADRGATLSVARAISRMLEPRHG
jgi:hypothetical protein